MNKFKVGNRVAVYSGRERLVGSVFSIISEDVLGISFSLKSVQVAYHVKQVRRLKKKEHKIFWAPTSLLEEDMPTNISLRRSYTRVKVVK